MKEMVPQDHAATVGVVRVADGQCALAPSTPLVHRDPDPLRCTGTAAVIQYVPSRSTRETEKLLLSTTIPSARLPAPRHGQDTPALGVMMNEHQSEIARLSVCQLKNSVGAAAGA